MPTGVEEPWKGWVRRRPSKEWLDPTFAAVEMRMPRRVRHSHVITRMSSDERRFWDGEHWTESLNLAQRFSSEVSAWDVAECLQDGFIDVELLPE